MHGVASHRGEAVRIFPRGVANGHSRFGSRATRFLSKVHAGLSKKELEGAARLLGTIARTIRGRRRASGCLVTIDDQLLPLPQLSRQERRHSPDGFEWGYGGSGPAELARAILIALYPCLEVTRHSRCYQEFKKDVIASLEGDEFVLTGAEVDAWLAQFLRENPKALSAEEVF